MCVPAARLPVRKRAAKLTFIAFKRSSLRGRANAFVFLQASGAYAALSRVPGTGRGGGGKNEVFFGRRFFCGGWGGVIFASVVKKRLAKTRSRDYEQFAVFFAVYVRTHKVSSYRI